MMSSSSSSPVLDSQQPDRDLLPSASASPSSQADPDALQNPPPPSAEPASSSNGDEKHPKSKRKRTAYVDDLRPSCLFCAVLAESIMLTAVPCSSSAKDKTILEAAYKANPKPDKAARLEIVERVSLNEKEVQVCHRMLYPGGATRPHNALPHL